MRFFGHPVHPMLIHFPVALWPAHCALHIFARKIPDGAAAVAGFWILVAATTLGWLAAACGAMDLFDLAQSSPGRRFTDGLIHASINGVVLVAFTLIAVLEAVRYPEVQHGSGFLVAEALLLGAMFAGNYFGGAIVWRTPDHPADAKPRT